MANRKKEDKYEDILQVLNERPHQTASEIASELAVNSADWTNQWKRVWEAKEAGLIVVDFVDKRFTVKR